MMDQRGTLVFRQIAGGGLLAVLAGGGVDRLQADAAAGHRRIFLCRACFINCRKELSTQELLSYPELGRFLWK